MSQTKVIRGQVRIAVKEELPEILKSELADQIRKELTEQFNERFTNLAKHLQTTLDSIDVRSKDVQAYVVRQANKA